MNRIRNFIERKAEEWIFANRRSKWDFIIFALEEGLSPQSIAEKYGGRNIILGCIYLLAANHMKKSGIRPEKG